MKPAELSTLSSRESLGASGLLPLPHHGSGSRSVEPQIQQPGGSGRSGTSASYESLNASASSLDRKQSSSSRANDNPSLDDNVVIAGAPSQSSSSYVTPVDYESFLWRPGQQLSSRGEERLRTMWEALLEDAAKCVDEARQPEMLRRVTEVMGWCIEAGISVKYGRKV